MLPFKKSLEKLNKKIDISKEQQVIIIYFDSLVIYTQQINNYTIGFSQGKNRKVGKIR